MENELISIADLFGRHHALRGGKVLNERATLIGFFSTEMTRPAPQIGVRLAHYSLDDLYGLQSAFKDRLHRDGKEQAQKYFWWMTRMHTLSTVQPDLKVCLD